MNKINLDDWLDDDPVFLQRRGRPQAASPQQRRPSRRSQAEIVAELVEYGDPSGSQAEAVFMPTFTSSRHERDWILNYLSAFYEDRQISDVLRKVKGGKEANVYCCEAHPDTGMDLIAAKIYRPRMFRQLRNDARYRQGRKLLGEDGKEIRDGRRLRAVARKTEYGHEVQHASWLEHEFRTLQELFAAGADVPRPLAHGNNTILMEYVGELDAPAPTLNQVALGPAEARPLFERLLRNVELMLSRGRIHADLSAYNVLYWSGDIRIIDFPQAVDPRVNPDAQALHERDVERLCQYFARYRIPADAKTLAAEMWARHGLPPSGAEQQGDESEDE